MVACEAAAAAEHAMARHHEGERVAADGGADRAGGIRPVEPAGDIGIGRRAA
jgi:hypothetical protein